MCPDVYHSANVHQQQLDGQYLISIYTDLPEIWVSNSSQATVHPSFLITPYCPDKELLLRWDKQFHGLNRTYMSFGFGPPS